MTEKKLTPKQQRFVDEYLIDLNATQAAIRAGYSEKTAGSIGEENLKKPEIQTVIQAAFKSRQQRTELSQDEVLNDLRELRDMCMGRKPVKISQKQKDEDGNVYYEEVEMTQFDPQGANKSLELLGKHLSLWTEKIDVNVGVSDDVLEKMAQLEEQSRQQSSVLARKVEERNN